MSNSSPVKRSARKRQSNQKYTFDPFEDIDVSNSDSEHGAEHMRQLSRGRKDAEFGIERAEVFNEDALMRDDGSNGSEAASPDENSDGVSSIGEGEGEGEGEDSDASRVIEKDSSPVKHSRSDQLGNKGNEKKEQIKHEHIRGLIEQTKHIQGKEAVMKQFFGSDQRDWVPVLRSRDQWLAEPTLPKREPDENDIGGMHHLFSHTEEKRNMEAGVGWDWYYDQGGRELFRERQKGRTLRSNEGIHFIPKPSKPSHKFLMGPYGKQKQFDLPNGHSVCLNEAWNNNLSGSSGKGSSRERAKRDGWILNAGTGIRCLDWATNQDDQTQYLAIATMFPKPANQGLSQVSPAYTPSPPLRSCIQIWAFKAQGSSYGYLDSTRSPELQLVICTKWGEVKQLKWCPMPRIFRDEDSRGKVSLGLLAGIWADGHVRILNVQFERKGGSVTTCVRYDAPAFQARPPNTLCTCVTWLSATDIAVGCANGFLAIWDISGANPEKSPGSDALNPSPWLYIYLHQSYILAICSAYPSHPQFLATSSMDGFMRLTDLRAPNTDYVFTSRSRIASSTIVFSDPLLSFVSTEENDYVRIYPLRCFYTTVSIARADSFPLCLSVGHFHPTILIGCADGSVIATNPIRKVLYRKVQQYQQTVFRHEWTRGRDDGAGGIEMSRITEGYKVVSMTLQRDTTQQAQEGMVMSTIHEEEEGVTQVVWNPNLRCGGWVAAGMGSGLVRVQDLAI